jgi:homogentisate 1,2-dioxygenase
MNANALRYMTGLGGHFESEAVEGALPKGRNSPQRPAFGLYTEQLSGSAFTAPRHENRRSWLYRMRPTADHRPFVEYDRAPLFGAEPGRAPLAPNRLRWDPPADLPADGDFVDGMATMLHAGMPDALEGVAVHLYRASRSMERRVFVDADGELLIMPQQGTIEIQTELGRLEVAPGFVAIVPRGMKFRVLLMEGEARGYVAENYGLPFRLPDLGPIGANGLASARDFEVPVAWFEDLDEQTEVVQKYLGQLWTTTLDHSPLDVVAWHGNYAPCRYDLSRFNAIGTVSFDHPDP